jgi:hypothetical protein
MHVVRPFSVVCRPAAFVCRARRNGMRLPRDGCSVRRKERPNSVSQHCEADAALFVWLDDEPSSRQSG